MSEQNTQLTLNPDSPEERFLLLQERRFELAQRQAKAICAAGELIPKAYRNNIGATMIAMNMATRMRCEPLQIMQSLNVIHGKPGFSAAFLIAQINQSTVISGNLEFEVEDLGPKTVPYSITYYESGQKRTNQGTENIDDSRCRAFGVNLAGTVLYGPWVSVEMAVLEGWYSKPGSKWKTMKELMLNYRAAAFWSRTNAPELSLVMQTSEEIADTEEKDITPKPHQIATAQAIFDDTAEPEFSPVIGKESEKAENIDEEADNSEPNSETTTTPDDDNADNEPPPSVDLSRPIWVTDESLDEGGYYIDHFDDKFDINQHGLNRETKAPSMTADGHFRKKRAAKAKAAPVVEEKVEPKAEVVPDNELPEIIEPSKNITELRAEFPIFDALLNHIKGADDVARVNQLMGMPSIAGFPESAQSYLKEQASDKIVMLEAG